MGARLSSSLLTPHSSLLTAYCSLLPAPCSLYLRTGSAPSVFQLLTFPVAQYPSLPKNAILLPRPDIAHQGELYDNHDTPTHGSHYRSVSRVRLGPLPRTRTARLGPHCQQPARP